MTTPAGNTRFGVVFMRKIFLFLLIAALLPAPEARAEVRLPVVMYHHISQDPARACDYVVTPEQLEGDLRWLSERGCTAVSAREVIDYCAGRGELPEKPVLLTFDDGQLSVLAYALPLLEKYGMCAVAAVVGAYCDAEAGAQYRSPVYSYMTWPEVAELASSGRFEIASHTQDMHEESSPRRGCLPRSGETPEQYAAALNADLETVESGIEAATGARPLVFAYPFGFHCEAAAEVLRERGYALVLTCENSVNTLSVGDGGLLELARFNRPASADREVFFTKLGL